MMKESVKVNSSGVLAEKVIENTDMHKYSRLANASYTYHATKGSHAKVAEELRVERYNYIQDLKDFKVDKKLSSLDDIVLHNSLTGETVVSYRGTATGYDWWRNLRIAFGFNSGQDSRRFKRAEEVANRTMTKYGRSNLSFVGHSQGGGVSSVMGQKFNIDSHNFNPAISFKQIAENRSMYKLRGFMSNFTRQATHTNYCTDTDFVSINKFSPSIQRTMKVVHVSSVPGVDKDITQVHGLGENFAPPVEQQLDGKVLVTRNRKAVSIARGVAGVVQAGVIAIDYTLDVTEDVKTGSVLEKTKKVGIDTVKQGVDLKAGNALFDAALPEAGATLFESAPIIGLAVGASVYFTAVAEDLAEELKDIKIEEDYSTYGCTGPNCADIDYDARTTDIRPVHAVKQAVESTAGMSTVETQVGVVEELWHSVTNLFGGHKQSDKSRRVKSKPTPKPTPKNKPSVITKYGTKDGVPIILNKSAPSAPKQPAIKRMVRTRQEPTAPSAPTQP